MALRKALVGLAGFAALTAAGFSHAQTLKTFDMVSKDGYTFVWYPVATHKTDNTTALDCKLLIYAEKITKDDLGEHIQLKLLKKTHFPCLTKGAGK